MGCGCGKNKIASKSTKVVKRQVKPVNKLNNNTTRRVIRRSAY